MNKIQLSNEEMYQALVERNSQYEGLFVVGVKTTGIFCRPTCTARKPKLQNVEFFEEASEALRHGYRACKVCSPMRPFSESPAWLSTVLAIIAKDPSRKWSDPEIAAQGYSPSVLRRYFKKTHGITFQAYLRMTRMNHAFQAIRKGSSVTASAFKQGYDSLSGFSDAFKHATGFSPKSPGEVITINRIITPLGPMMIGVVAQGLCLLEFTDRRMLEKQLEILEKRTGASLVHGNHALIDLVQEQLDEYFEGNRKAFDVPLFLPGSAFQKKVWSALISIPYGSTRSYKQQANAVGDVKAVRAVARANGENRISIIIPCHRVIGSDGSIVGYGGGIHRKQWLLKHEFENS